MQLPDNPPPIPQRREYSHPESPGDRPPPIPEAIDHPAAPEFSRQAISASHLDWKALRRPRHVRWKMLPLYLLIILICLPLLSLLNITSAGVQYLGLYFYEVINDQAIWFEAVFLAMFLFPIFLLGQWSNRWIAAALVVMMSLSLIGFGFQHMTYATLYLMHLVIPPEIDGSFSGQIILENYSTVIMDWKNYQPLYYYSFWVLQASIFALPVILDRWFPTHMIGLIAGSLIALALAIMEQPLWFIFEQEEFFMEGQDIFYYIGFTLGWWFTLMFPFWTYALFWRLIMTQAPGASLDMGSMAVHDADQNAYSRSKDVV